MEKEKKSIIERFKSLPMSWKVIVLLVGILAIMVVIGLIVDSSNSSKKLLTSNNGNNSLVSKGPSDKVIIQCAQSEVSKLLKSSSTARWGTAKILDKDNYNRYLVYVPLEATNSFGAYSKSEFMVIIRDVTPSGEYYANYFSTQEVTGFASSVNNYQSDDWSGIKEKNHWNEPVQDTNK